MLKIVNKSVDLLICVLVSSGLAVEKPTTPQKTCMTAECHTEYGKMAEVHGPVALGDCKSCHKPLNVQEHTYQLAREGADLCQYCHLDQTTKKHLHNPLEDEGGCTQCHDPHGSDNKFFLSSKTVADSCKECHEVTKDMKFLHGPVAAGECTVCHDPHGSDYENLLGLDPNDFCFSCHEVTQNELKKFEFVHEPAKGECSGCHDAHGANNAQLLTENAPKLCYSCHEDIQKTAETSKYKHSAVTEPGGCLSCHTPHASTVRHGLKAAPLDLCLKCHDKEIKVDKNITIGNFAAQIKDKQFLHGPVGEKDCEGCHVAHGSNYFHLLAKEYPPQFYAPFSKENYDLCFSCHSESIVLTRETSDLTDFRNGSTNLHFMHVNKESRGRTCRSCHATHASDKPGHIRQSVPYGKWDLPVGFTKRQTGGTCESGCHMPYTYDRESPVDYRESPAADVTVSADAGK